MRRPRLKLITLPWELEVPTLSLASLAAVTPDRFDIAIVDLLRERLVLDEEVDLVGISASTPRIKAAYALADLYRQRGVKVVLGGHHPTAMPQEALQHADAVVLGEGELSWMRICDQFLTNPARVHGIYHDPAPDLSTLPVPRTDLMKMDRYSAFSYPIIATRGCIESCSFCFSKRMTRGYRTYPIAQVLEQVRRRPAFVKALYFVDDNLPGHEDYAKELFRALRPFNVSFGMQARWEFCQDPENLVLARDAGCGLISSGYESVNQGSLDGTGKRASSARYKEVIGNIANTGIIPSGNWMFGFDWDTPEVFADTLAFLDESDLFHCSFTAEIPFPGTAAFRRYKKEGRILTDDYDEYVGKDHVVVKPKQMTPEQLREGIRWLTLQFYSVERANRRFLKGIKNPAFRKGPVGQLGTAGMAILNYFQVWQWHYRMVPAIQWLYGRILSTYKYRYFTDLLRGTNFWSRTLPLAPPPAEIITHAPESVFVHKSGLRKSPKSSWHVVGEVPQPIIRTGTD